jgi:hypothetical protein
LPTFSSPSGIGYWVPHRKLIVELETFVSFLQSHRATDPELWFRPLSPGKWSPHDIVAHIMMWDKHFLSESIRGIEAGQMVPLQEQPDYQEHNDRAVAVGHKMSKDQLLNEAVRARLELVNRLTKLERNAFIQPSASGNGMTLEEFLQRAFVEHDKHHVEQVAAFMSTLVK